MRISTIIPAYNRADLIGETLRTVLAQTRPPDEVIVVDDGSSDGTPDLISEQFGAAVTLLRQQNAGAGAARNAGLAHATGDIIHFQDSDDLSSLNTYAVQAPLIEAGADVVYGPWLKTRFDGQQLTPEPVALQQGPVPPSRPLDVHTLMVTWVTVFQPCLFRRSVLDAVGPYRLDLAPSEDIELMSRITRHTARFVHSGETILLYRVHPENQISEQNQRKVVLDRANVWTLFRSAIDARPDISPWHRALFNVKKLEIAREVAGIDAQRAAELAEGSSTAHHLARPLHAFYQRAIGRLRVMQHGHGYSPAQAAGSLTEGQKQQIALLGYQLPAGMGA